MIPDDECDRKCPVTPRTLSPNSLHYFDCPVWTFIMYSQREYTTVGPFTAWADAEQYDGPTPAVDVPREPRPDPRTILLDAAGHIVTALVTVAMIAVIIALMVAWFADWKMP